MANTATPQTRHPIQYVALIYGIVFLLVGILGFIPGITTDYDTLKFAGHHSDAMLLGLFQVSWLHNIVHLIYGIAGVSLWRTSVGSRYYLLWGGIGYAVLWIYGMLVASHSDANFVPLNSGDNWLHFALAVTMIILSFLRVPRAPANAKEPTSRIA